MADTPSDARLEEALRTLSRERATLPEPSYSQLEAYAAGRLSPGERLEVERVLALRSDLRQVVEAMRTPEPSLSSAIRRAIARKKRKAWLWFVAPAAVVALAAVMFLRSPGGSSQVSIARGSIEWSDGLRSGAEPVRQFPAGKAVSITLRPPQGSRYAVLLEVSDRTVQAQLDTPVTPGVEQTFNPTMTADRETTNFLVVVYLERPIVKEVLADDLAKEAKRGAPLYTQDSASRLDRVARALQAPDRSPIWIDILGLYRVTP